ncbi:transmembrane protein 87A isoform X2 [Biomphalaria glabrata]|nr:transmembrane protein 87A isoform X2 [Biomphalaria glabrata]
MAAMLSSLLLFFLTISVLWQPAFCKPSQGVWDFTIDKENTILYLTKSAFTDTQLSVSITCENDQEVDLQILWFFGRQRCANVVWNQNETEVLTKKFSGILSNVAISSWFSHYAYKLESFHCTKNKHITLHPANVTVEEDSTTKQNTKEPGKETKGASTLSQEEGTKKTDSGGGKNENANRRKRDTQVSETDKPKVETPKNDPAVIPAGDKIDHDARQLIKAWTDGYYMFFIKFLPANSTSLPDDLNIKVNIRFSYGDSYLAAVDWPLLFFYGIMGLVYIGFGLMWLIMLACNWRDLLRVQFWIGGVILLGMLEKAVFFAEYENINKTGQSVKGAIIFAELVSCLKRTLARMLVIIVSLGYGIVKPRLGQTFHKILAVGLIFFILASIEGCMRVLTEKTDQSKQQLLPGVPLAKKISFLDSLHIFTSLLQTTRTLRLRRNVVKLSLYRHFTNTLIFAVLASIAYMIWSLTQHKFKECLSDWKELWLDDAFWHLLFSSILFVIMILWRPTVNNQRYAFSPLLDAAEDELEDDPQLSEAYDGMKMRSKPQRNGGPNANEDGKNLKQEDDLKWVEENIPTSFADKLLPSLDSDEEIMNTKFEVSKME